MSGPTTHRARWVVVAVAVGTRLVAALTLTRAPEALHDPLLYQRFAQGIARGDGYTSFFGKPTAYYPPGYPFFLGGLQWICDRLGAHGSLPIASALAQALLGGLAAWAIVGAGDRVRPALEAAPWPQRLGVVAGLVFALWPNLVLQSTTLLSEPLFLAVFSCFLLALLVAMDRVRDEATRSRRWLLALVVAGALLGLSVLVRPQVALVMAGVAVAVLFARLPWTHRGAVVAVPLVAAVLVVLPWTIRNATVFDRLVAVSTNGGDNLCVGFHDGATGHFEIPEMCNRLPFYTEGPAAEVRRNAETGRLARSWAVHHVSALPALSVKKLWYTYQNDRDGLRAVESYEDHRFLPGAVRAVLRWASDLYYLAVMASALFGVGLAVRSVRRRDARSAQLVLLVGATLASGLVPVLFFGEARFKVPTTPCFALLAGLAIATFAARGARPGDLEGHTREHRAVEPEVGRGSAA